MGLFMKAILKLICLIEKAGRSMPMVAFMKENGRMINFIIKEYILAKMGVNMKVIGMKINSKDQEWKPAQMALDM